MGKHSDLRKKAKLLCMEWVKSMVPEGEDRDLITEENFEQFLPEETHYYAGGSRRMHAMTPKWITKKLKKNPNLTLEELLDGLA